MALIDDNVLSFMFEGVRRGDEDKLKAALNANGEVTLKLLKNESPNLFRSIFHFALVKKYIPQEATPIEPPPDWAVHDEIPELIVEKEEAPLEVVAVAEVEIDEPIVHFNGFNQVIEGSETPLPPEEDHSADDLLIVEGDELTGETEAVKFPEKEEIPVDKVDDTPIVKAPKAKKAK